MRSVVKIQTYERRSERREQSQFHPPAHQLLQKVSLYFVSISVLFTYIINFYLMCDLIVVGKMEAWHIAAIVIVSVIVILFVVFVLSDCAPHYGRPAGDNSQNGVDSTSSSPSDEGRKVFANKKNRSSVEQAPGH